jgi:hypothetical protein
MAESSPEGGSEDQRRPEAIEAMQQVRSAETGLLGRIQRD